MSHSQRCLSANRFGDGFDCICEPHPSYRIGYAAGLRRAQELAKELVDTIYVGYGSVVEFDRFDAAIDAEAKK